MPKRIFLVHPTPLAVAPVDEAFKTLWPQAQVLNLLDESLYADVGANGELTPALYARVANLFRHCEETAGTSQFGLPRLPDDHLPGILPRAALERFWPEARLFLALAEPLTWPLHMAHAAHKLMLAMKGSITPDLALKIVMEAAVPMSRVDPTTVPNN